MLFLFADAPSAKPFFPLNMEWDGARLDSAKEAESKKNRALRLADGLICNAADCADSVGNSSSSVQTTSIIVGWTSLLWRQV